MSESVPLRPVAALRGESTAPRGATPPRPSHVVCQSKVPYSSADDARQFCNGNGRGTRRPYRCDHCGMYHLTSKSKKELRRSRRRTNNTTRRPAP
jgi:hypothetical protein